MQSFIHTIYRYEPQKFIIYIEEIHIAFQPLFYPSPTVRWNDLFKYRSQLHHRIIIIQYLQEFTLLYHLEEHLANRSREE